MVKKGIKIIWFITVILNAILVFRTTYRSAYLIDEYVTSAGDFYGGSLGIAMNWLAPVFAVIVVIGAFIWLVKEE